MIERMLSVRQVADALKVSPAKVRALIKAREIAAIRVSGNINRSRLRVPESELRRVIDGGNRSDL